MLNALFCVVCCVVQGKDVVVEVEVPPEHAVVFSGKLVHAGAAGSSSGGPQHRVHVYYGGERDDDATFPLVYRKGDYREHVQSMERRFTIRR
jgi:hypothetical protein